MLQQKEQAKEKHWKNPLIISLIPRIAPQSKGTVGHLTRKEIDYANAILIDKLARYFFPLAWLVFELVYFFFLVEIHQTNVS